MRTLRCKCGDAVMHTSMSPFDCEGCEKCQTTFAGHPDNHKPLQPHEWKTLYNQNTGKPYKVCKHCHKTDEVSYLESKKKGK
jgi:hypothetical protein